MTCRTNLSIVVKIIDLDISHIYSHNYTRMAWTKLLLVGLFEDNIHIKFLLLHLMANLLKWCNGDGLIFFT